MAHDSEVYPEPFAFRPERFLGPAPAPDPDYAFGFGRRICVGQHLALTSTYVLAANMLALFDIERAKGPDGTALEVPIEYEGEGIVSVDPPSLSARSAPVLTWRTGSLSLSRSSAFLGRKSQPSFSRRRWNLFIDVLIWFDLHTCTSLSFSASMYSIQDTFTCKSSYSSQCNGPIATHNPPGNIQIQIVTLQQRPTV